MLIPAKIYTQKTEVFVNLQKRRIEQLPFFEIA